MSIPAHSAAPNVVVVDPRFDSYRQLADSARLGRINLHMRSSGADALKLARRHDVDVWLIAADLDDMSGHDLVELLRDKSSEAKVCVVDAAPGSRLHAVAEQEATASGADAVLTKPITLRDLEELLGLPAAERSKILGGVARSFITLPVGVGAAAVSVAVLLLG